MGSRDYLFTCFHGNSPLSLDCESQPLRQFLWFPGIIYLPTYLSLSGLWRFIYYRGWPSYINTTKEYHMVLSDCWGRDYYSYWYPCQLTSLFGLWVSATQAVNMVSLEYLFTCFHANSPSLSRLWFTSPQVIPIVSREYLFTCFQDNSPLSLALWVSACRAVLMVSRDYVFTGFQGNSPLSLACAGPWVAEADRPWLTSLVSRPASSHRACPPSAVCSHMWCHYAGATNSHCNSKIGLL